MPTVSPQGYQITKDPVNNNPFWESEEANPQALLPSGGATGDILRKKTANNYDTEWVKLPEYVTPETLVAAVQEVTQKVTEETQGREQDITDVNNRIDGLDIPDISPLEQAIVETNNRINNLQIPDVTGLTQDVADVKQTVASQGEAQASLTETVNTNQTNMTEKVDGEIQARIDVDNALQEQLTRETQAREQFEQNVRQVPVSALADSGKVLTVNETGVPEWAEPSGGGGEAYTLPIATEQVLGGVKAVTKTTETVPVAVDTEGKLYVPEQSGGGGGGESYTLPQATETALGGIKAKAKTTETVEVAIDTATGKLYVPEQSGGGGGGESYTLPQATETALGGIKAKAKTTETVEVAIDTATGKLYVPEQSGGGSGGSAEPVLLASHGDISLANLTGGEAVSGGSLKLTKAVDIFAQMVNYKQFGVLLIMPSTDYGVIGATFYNPYYKKTMTNATKKFSHTFLIDAKNYCVVDFSQTGSDYTPTVTFKFITSAGAVATNIKVIGAAIYGLN